MKSCLAAIILAAGFSSRMEPFKPLLPAGSETITDRIITTFLRKGIEVYLVVGWRQDELKAGIKNYDITFVENRDYAKGMFTSVQAGLRALQANHKAFFIMPVDIPLVRPFTIKQLSEASENQPDKIIYPVFRKMRGHPTLIPVKLVPFILKWEKEGGLKAFLDTHEAMASEVPVPDSNILFDVDTPEDYRLLKERLQHDEIPTEDECEAILSDICSVPQNVRSHSLKVAEIAQMIGQALLKAGQKPDLTVIRAAALLHDIARGQTNHDATGARMLEEMGFTLIGDIVSHHIDLPEDNSSVSLESRVVYLADKFVQGEAVVPVEERFQSAISRFGGTSEVETKILRRKQQALSMKAEFEAIIGRKLDTIIFR